jgi:hypothetical protein
MDESRIATLPSRIWERIQEESYGAEDLDVDIEDNRYSGEGRDTEEIGRFVAEVLRTISQPWPPDVTEQICLCIERNGKWLTHYQKLVKEFGPLTVNSSIGMYAKELTGMENTNRMGTAKSRLLKSYSILASSAR